MSGEPTWLLPAEPRPVRLMNTIRADRDGLHDELGSEQQLAAWLQVTGSVADAVEVSAGELAAAQQLRDALRDLAAWSTDDPRPIVREDLDVDAAIEVINRSARPGAAPPLLRRDGAALRRETPSAGSATEMALASVAAEAIELFTDEAASPLRPCLAPRCVLYYVQRDARRRWCSPGCGNRARVARHYRRTHASAP